VSAASLPLRDVHLPAPPGWWPLAPGWWLLIALVLAALLAIGAVWMRRRHRRKRWRALFDAALAAAPSPSARIGAASELLRRAARHAAAGAATLQGGDWLRFLDGAGGHDFSEGEGRLVLDGGFRPDIDEALAARACLLARRRFLELMERRR